MFEMATRLVDIFAFIGYVASGRNRVDTVYLGGFGRHKPVSTQN
jgi:hypothetical protein